MSCPKCKKGQLLAMTGPFGDFMRCSRKGCGYVELVPDEDSMRLSCASLPLEPGDRVTVRYRPASSVPLRYREPLEVPAALHAQLGNLYVFGKPAVVVGLLGEALRDCLSVWDGEGLREQDDAPANPRLRGPKTSPAPLTRSEPLAAALSGVAAGDGDSRLPLTGMSGGERHNLRCSGAGAEARSTA